MRPVLNYSTPAGIRGPLMRDLYAQKRADEEYQDLVSSTAPSAGVKAFTKGFAVGAAMPVTLGIVVPTLLRTGDEHDAAKATAVLTHYLKSKGMSEADAIKAAPSLKSFLSATQSLPPSALLEKLTPDMKTYSSMMQGVQGPFTSKDDAVEAITQHFRKNRPDAKSSIADIKRMAEAYTFEIPGPKPGHLTSLRGISNTQVASILDAANRSFAEAGEHAPSALSVGAKTLWKHSKGALLGTSILGALGGSYAYLGVKRRRKMLQDLQNRARRQP
jgi:hypothetical protein